MTDPTGRSFLSYRRSRLEEARLLVAAQHELGIPTWQAVDVAQLIVEGFQKARERWRPRGIVHLFTAIPAGLGVLVGQLLNTLGPIQLYEHLEEGLAGRYEPSVLLEPLP